MPYKYTMILQLTTAPVDAAAASAHIGGWSESHWRNDNPDPTAGPFLELMQRRANLLPAQGNVVGYRVGSYTLAGNKIYPGTTSTGRVFLPGGSFSCDVPQMALQLNTGSSAANSSRIVLRGLPDDLVINGEYKPITAYKGAVTRFITSLTSGDWGFIGRDLTQPAIRVIKVSAGVLTTDGSSPLIAGVDWVRFHKVVDSLGNPVSGAYFIGSSPGTNQFALSGFPTDVTVGANGTIRRDIVARYNYTNVTPGRVVVRKVGRPLEQYRGRRSKRRAA